MRTLSRVLSFVKILQGEVAENKEIGALYVSSHVKTSQISKSVAGWGLGRASGRPGYVQVERRKRMENEMHLFPQMREFRQYLNTRIYKWCFILRLSSPISVRYGAYCRVL